MALFPQYFINDFVTNLDFKNGLITFEHTKSEEKGRGLMNDYLATELSAYLKNKKSERVISMSDSKPYSKSRINRKFRKVVNIAKIRDFRFHDLRHTFASYLVMNGTDWKTLQELGRWKSHKMVLRYAHLSASHKKKAIESLTSLFEKKSAPIGNASLVIL